MCLGGPCGLHFDDIMDSWGFQLMSLVGPFGFQFDLSSGFFARHFRTSSFHVIMYIDGVTRRRHNSCQMQQETDLQPTMISEAWQEKL